MKLSLLLAASENNVIGKNNQLPWHLPNDLKYFKNLTWGLPILMGRKTFESIGKPLPGRKSVVITRQRGWRQEGVDIVYSVKEAIKRATNYGAKEIFVIGGAEIFKTSLPMADRIYLTRIHQQFEGDVFFSELDENEWQLASDRFCEKDEKNSYDHSYQVWERLPVNSTSL
jgi:dihydrofolate reductase